MQGNLVQIYEGGESSDRSSQPGKGDVPESGITDLRQRSPTTFKAVPDYARSPSPHAVSQGTVRAVESTMKMVSAEDVLGDKRPEQVFSELSGMDSKAFNLSIVGGTRKDTLELPYPVGDYEVFVRSSPGEEATNADALSLWPKDNSLFMVMGHGPQNQDSKCGAAIANAAVIRGTYELAAKGRDLDFTVREMMENAAAVGNEVGENKLCDLFAAKMTPSLDGYQLEVASSGDIRMMVLAPDDGSTLTLPVTPRISRQRLTKLHDKMQEITMETLENYHQRKNDLKKFENRRGYTIEQIRAELLKKQVGVILDMAQRLALAEYIQQRYINGSNPSEIVSIMDDFFSSPDVNMITVHAGNIIIITNEEVLRAAGVDEDRGEDTNLTEQILAEMKKGEALETACSNVLKRLEAKRNEEVVDACFTLIAFQVPKLPGSIRQKPLRIEDIDQKWN